MSVPEDTRILPIESTPYQLTFSSAANPFSINRLKVQLSQDPTQVTAAIEDSANRLGINDPQKWLTIAEEFSSPDTISTFVNRSRAHNALRLFWILHHTSPTLSQEFLRTVLNGARLANRITQGNFVLNTAQRELARAVLLQPELPENITQYATTLLSSSTDAVDRAYVAHAQGEQDVVKNLFLNNLWSNLRVAAALATLLGEVEIETWRGKSKPKDLVDSRSTDTENNGRPPTMDPSLYYAQVATLMIDPLDGNPKYLQDAVSNITKFLRLGTIENDETVWILTDIATALATQQPDIALQIRSKILDHYTAQIDGIPYTTTPYARLSDSNRSSVASLKAKIAMVEGCILPALPADYDKTKVIAAEKLLKDAPDCSGHIKKFTYALTNIIISIAKNNPTLADELILQIEKQKTEYKYMTSQLDTIFADVLAEYLVNQSQHQVQGTPQQVVDADTI